MLEPGYALDYARMYVEVMGWVRAAEESSDAASLLETAEYFYKLSLASACRIPGPNAGPLKQLSFGEMHDLADMLEGWAQDPERDRAEQGRLLTLSDTLRDVAEVAGPGWVAPTREDDEPSGILAFLARLMAQG